MQPCCYADEDLSAPMRAAIALYRYRVFVEQMGWELHCAAGCEQDEFDAAGAVHVVAFDVQGRIVGYGRLLPTTQRYLLETHFSALVYGSRPPRTPAVWELSRYTASAAHGTGAQEVNIGKRVLLAALRFVQGRGGDRVVCCTTVAIERLSNRWGVPMGRLGPPQRMGAFLLVAGTIEINAQVCQALAAAERPVRALPLLPARGQGDYTLATPERAARGALVALPTAA